MPNNQPHFYSAEKAANLHTVSQINPEQFLASVRDAFGQPPQNLSMVSILRDVDGWDSLTSVMLVAQIYADYGVQVSGDDLNNCRTLQDLVSLVQSKL